MKEERIGVLLTMSHVCVFPKPGYTFLLNYNISTRELAVLLKMQILSPVNLILACVNTNCHFTQNSLFQANKVMK